MNKFCGNNHPDVQAFDAGMGNNFSRNGWNNHDFRNDYNLAGGSTVDNNPFNYTCVLPVEDSSTPESSSDRTSSTDDTSNGSKPSSGGLTPGFQIFIAISALSLIIIFKRKSLK